MKKSTKILFLTIIIVLLFALVACGEENASNVGAVDCTEGHDFGEWKAVSEATCFADGCKIRICKRCSEIETDKLSSDGHNFDEGVCTACGMQETDSDSGDAQSPELQATKGLWYMLSDDKESYTVVGLGMAESPNVVITDEHNGKPVTAIIEKGFQLNTIITGVKIIGNVQLGARAFGSCSNLTTAEFGKGVTVISEGVMVSCGNLTEVTISADVTKIETLAFSGCSKLQTINYAGSVEQWELIEKGNVWINNKIYIVKCTDGEIAADGTVTKNN